MIDETTGKLVPVGNRLVPMNMILGFTLADEHTEGIEVMNMKEDDKPYNNNDWIEGYEDEQEDDDIDWGDDDDDDEDDWEDDYEDDGSGDDIDWDEDDDEDIDVGF